MQNNLSEITFNDSSTLKKAKEKRSYKSEHISSSTGDDLKYYFKEFIDETILIARAEKTDTKILKKSVELLKSVEKSTFSGVVLNGFNLRKNYGSYYYK